MTDRTSKQLYVLVRTYEEDPLCTYKIIHRPGDVVGWLNRNTPKNNEEHFRAFLFPQMIEITETHIQMRLLKEDAPKMEPVSD